MIAAIKIISIFMIVIAILWFFALLFGQYKKGRREILDELFKNGEITPDTYKKYLKDKN